jgi:hypothetical protein
MIIIHYHKFIDSFEPDLFRLSDFILLIFNFEFTPDTYIDDKCFNFIFEPNKPVWLANSIIAPVLEFLY